VCPLDTEDIQKKVVESRGTDVEALWEIALQLSQIRKLLVALTWSLTGEQKKWEPLLKDKAPRS